MCVSECVRVSVLECESRKSHACHAKGAETKGRQRDARGTPETYITPLAEQKVARLPRKRRGDQGRGVSV